MARGPNVARTPHAAGRRPEVLVLCPTLFGVRNVLHSRLLPQLLSFGVGARVLTRYPQQAAHGGLGLLQSPRSVSRAWDMGLTALDTTQRASFFKRYGLNSDGVTLWWYRRADPFARRVSLVALEQLAFVGQWAPLYRWQTKALSSFRRRAWDLAPFRRELEAHRPAMVVATSGIDVLEAPYLLAAQDLGIPTLGCIQSFDHLTGRSHVAPCDQYAVWNRRMREQLLTYHQARDPARVHVTGTAQFDFHRDPAFRWSREDTLRRLGLAEGDRYILHAANTWFQAPSEPLLVREFARRCAMVPELKDHRLVVRLHPLDEFGRWNDAVAAEPRMALSFPSAQSERFNDPDDQARLVSSLAHADVCLNMWSSMSLDAAVLDTPVVCVAFAGERDGAEDRFCNLAYEADFYRPIVASGGVRMARSMDELVSETAAYAGDRSRDHAARARLAEDECGPPDGKSAERLAELIARLVVTS